MSQSDVALDPAFCAFLQTPGIHLVPPAPGVTLSMLRTAAQQFAPQFEPRQVHSTREIFISVGSSGLRVRLYYPSGAPNLPLILYFHGGGFVLGDLDGYDSLCRALTTVSDCAVASVEYRLAPETRFPGALEDCYAALGFLASEGSGFGFDTARIAVCGDSSGGNLAAAVALLARDRGAITLRYQGLIYPAIDAACDSASFNELAEGYLLSREAMRWFWDCYLMQPEDAANPLASPSRAADLAGLAPASVITAEYDPLRDEGEAYAGRLSAAGVPVICRRYLGMPHGFASMPSITPVAERAIADIGRDFHTALTSC